MSLEQISLPPYSRKMEFWNASTHGLGIIFSLIAGPIAIAKAIKTTDALGVAAIAIYVAFMILLYAGSTIYHAMKPGNVKRVLRVLDHNNVFLLVMGSYLPYCWIALRNPSDGFPWGWAIFGLVWGLSIMGIICNSINIIKFRRLTLIIQIAMGSVIVIACYPLYFSVGPSGFLTLLASGVLYWVGAALYAIAGKKNIWLHTVFHLFILAGSVVMFFAIYCFVL